MASSSAYGTFSAPSPQCEQEVSLHGSRPSFGWDYVFVFGTEEDEARTRRRILRRLARANFVYREAHISDEDAVYVLFALPEDELLARAERCGMKLQLRTRYGGGFMPFTRARARCFERATPHKGEGSSFFAPSDRALMLQGALRDEGVDYERLVTQGRMRNAFALHCPRERSAVAAAAVRLFRRLPLVAMKRYAGVRIAFYFAFVCFYTRMLLGLSLLSIPVFAVQHMLHSPALVAWSRLLFGVALVFWSTFFIEQWQRRRAVLAVQWGISDFQADSENELLPDFHGVLKPGFYCQGGFVNLDDLATPDTNVEDATSGSEPLLRDADGDNEDEQVVRIGGSGDQDFELTAVVTGLTLSHLPRYPYFSKNALQRRIYLTSLATLFFATCVGALTFLILFFKNELIEALGGYGLVKALPGIMTGLLIAVSDGIWKKGSNALTKWENHRTIQSYARAITLKRFAFQFVSNYVSLFYIAFVKPNKAAADSCIAGTDGVTPDCLSELETQLMALIITKATVQQVAELAVPGIRRWLAGGVSHDGCDDLVQATREARLARYRSPVEDYGELVIQYGYIAMFGLAFPLATVVSWANGLVERRTDAVKIFSLSRRVDASQAADIGGWLTILRLLSFVGVITNAALIVFTGNTLHYIVPELSRLHSLLAFVVVEHVLLGLKFAVHWLVNEKPGRTFRLLARQDYLAARLFGRNWKPYYAPRRSVDSDDEDEQQLVSDDNLKIN